jgi:hypothetical protein
VADTWVGGILTRLDLVVLERLPHGVFLRLGGGAPPVWFSPVMSPAPAGDAVTVATAMPFLEQFLAEAEPFWRDVREGRLRSEPFIVEDLESGELGLVATAISLGPRQFLVLGVAPDFEQRRQSLQVAREGMLEHEQHVRRTGALLGPIERMQRRAAQLTASGLTAEQQTLAQGLSEELAAIARAIENLAPLPKGVRRV